MVKTKKENLIKFSKEQFLNAKKYIENRDVLDALLDDDKYYSFDEVDSILNEFLESEVQ